MVTDTNDRTRLLNVEPAEGNATYPYQTHDLPPSYQTAVSGLPYVPIHSISGQSSFGNYSAPESNQPQPTLYYLQPAPAQSTSSNGISALPTNQPFYLIAASSGQPLLVNPYRTSQPRPVRTQPRNSSAPRRDPEQDSPDNTCSDCGVGVLVIMVAALIFFLLIRAVTQR